MKWRRQQIIADPLHKHVYEVAKEFFCEDWKSFLQELTQGGDLNASDIGGTPEDYLDALRGRDGVPEAALDIKAVRAALQYLFRNGILKGTQQYERVRGARARYFVPDSEVL